jgi:hypothetical protein
MLLGVEGGQNSCPVSAFVSHLPFRRGFVYRIAVDAEHRQDVELVVFRHVVTGITVAVSTVRDSPLTAQSEEG